MWVFGRPSKQWHCFWPITKFELFKWKWEFWKICTPHCEFNSFSILKDFSVDISGCDCFWHCLKKYANTWINIFHITMLHVSIVKFSSSLWLSPTPAACVGCAKNARPWYFFLSKLFLRSVCRNSEQTFWICSLCAIKELDAQAQGPLAATTPL